ncbi:MAG: LysE family translocator, partial [Amphritea sp.]|nr:LysE family translocator [Amphritea sp.]
MEIQLLLTYLAAITLLTMTPGADTMITIRNSARGGWQDGFVTSIGICSGLFLHATVSALGISVILLQSAYAFTLLKLAGAAYLIWLGGASLLALLKGQGAFSVPDTAVQTFSARRSLREGFLSNALNPKTALFYMAFLPQFINPEGSALMQSLFLAGLHFLIAMIWQSLLAAGVNKARHLLQRPRFSQVFNGLAGSVLVFLGFKLATSE